MTTKNRRGQRPAAGSREHPYLLGRNGVPEDRARFLAVSFGLRRDEPDAGLYEVGVEA